MDLLYLHYRAGRWMAANRAATVTQARYVHPLLNNGFVRQSLARDAIRNESVIGAILSMLARQDGTRRSGALT